MAGGFTKYNKLEVTDLGTEGTGDRIALFNSDGRLIGYVLKENLENFVSLLGTEVGKPITGDLEMNSFSYIKAENDDYIAKMIVDVDNNLEAGFSIVKKATGEVSYINLNSVEGTSFGINDDLIGIADISITNANILIRDSRAGAKGLTGVSFFNKQNYRNAFAQLGDVQNATGHASYTDTAYSVGSPLTLLAGVNTVLPNNSGVIYDDEKPDDITTFYNGTTITGRDGDGLAIMIYFKATPSTINSELDIWIDIGGGIGELYRQTVYFRGATKKGVLYTLPTAYTRATWESNGGTVYVKASVNMTVYGMNFNISRTHKSKN